MILRIEESILKHNHEKNIEIIDTGQAASINYKARN